MSEAYEQFLALVEQAGAASRDEAERAAPVVLSTLAARIDRGEARQLAARLPPELSPWLFTTTPAEGFDVDEFLRRVATQLDETVGAVARLARAVFAALRRTVGPDEMDDLTAELPEDYLPLIAEAQGRLVRTMTADEFLGHVAARAGLDPDGARRAADAVLETLAERIAGGEVDDLVALLPPELHPPLRRGRSEDAVSMPVETFVTRVAEREGTLPPVARAHAAAVFATLREAVGEREFLDVTSQLPADYGLVGARP